jgi:hypothetical protein
MSEEAPNSTRQVSIDCHDAIAVLPFQILFERHAKVVSWIFWFMPVALFLYAYLVVVAYKAKAQWLVDWFQTLEPIRSFCAGGFPNGALQDTFGAFAGLAEHFLLTGAAAFLILLVLGCVALRTRTAEDWHRLSNKIPNFMAIYKCLLFQIALSCAFLTLWFLYDHASFLLVVPAAFYVLVPPSLMLLFPAFRRTHEVR